ncbi:MAG: protein kinase, partial [Campylobacterota bacterium]|nr:protein kinase [Campylobacterota bacterium]
MKLKHYGQYKCQKLLNNGGFGRVYEMMDTKSEQKYAFKVIQSSFLTNAIKNEHHALKVFKDNPNFLSSYGGAQYKNEFIFKFALANGGNLKQYIQAKGVLSEKNAKKMLMQLLQQIKIAHKNSIIHNDIKPENIVLDDGNYYLIDWSSSLTEQSDYYEMVSTDYLFMTPEHYNKQVRFSTDIYMLGHVLYYVLHGKLLFGLYSEMFESQMMQAHLSKVPQYDSKISMPMQNLLNGMLCKIPSKRISLEEIQNFLKTDTLTKNYAIEPLNEPLTVLDDEHTYRFYAKQNITIALFRYAIELENKDEYE